MGYTAWGFDFAYGSGITTEVLKANGCNFVCRYLSGKPGSGKDLSAQEVLNYFNAGINVVFNWETTGQEVSEAQGVADAHAAQLELDTFAAELLALNASARLVDAVKVTPVIFSCDAAPDGTVDADAVAYMRGANSVMGLSRSGGYGGYGAVQAMFNAGVIKYGWQTYAWSNGQWDARAQLQQYQNSVTVGPAQVDRDRATADDYGQCKWAAVPTPPPVPWPVLTGLAASVENTFATSGYQTAKLSWGPVADPDASYQGEIWCGNSVILYFQTKNPFVEGVSLTWNTTYGFRVQCHPTSARPVTQASAPFHFTTPGAYA